MADDESIEGRGYARIDPAESEKGTASEQFLEDLQFRAYTSIGKVPDEVSQQRRIQREQLKKKLLEKLMQTNSTLLPKDDPKAKKDVLNRVLNMIEDAKLPTRYQDPDHYFIMKQLEGQIKEALRADGKQQLMINANYPLVGTMPTGRVNAQTYCVPDSNDYLVVFEDQLFTFCNTLSKVIASCIPFEKIQQWHKEGMIWDKSRLSSQMHKLQEALLKQNEILYYFLDLIESYLVAGTPRTSKQYILESPYDALAFILVSSMEIFAMGHEYGHIFKGDLSTSPVAASLVGTKKVKEIIYSWEKELSADEIGFKLMLWNRQRMGNELGITKWNWEKIQIALSLYYWGPALYFSAMDIIDIGKNILTTGTPPPPYVQEKVPTVGSHPPPLMRRDRVTEMVANNYRYEAYPAGLVVLWTFDVLSATAIPFLLDLYNKGKRPHARWQHP